MLKSNLNCDVTDQVAVITYNNPPLNIMSINMLKELQGLIEACNQNEDVRVIIFTTAGDKVYTAGMDLDEMTCLNRSELHAYLRVSRDTFAAFEATCKPIIVAMKGIVRGGGLEMALASDFRICGENTNFALPEINVGIFPGGGGTQRLQRLIGQAKAKELIYFGKVFTAEDAQKWGIANKVVPNEQVLEEALNWARELKEKSPVALTNIKEVMQMGANLNLTEALKYESYSFLDMFNTEDRREGIQAFKEKRTAEYKNQ
ncbi:enoyl-CoA hydratase/isomerase family protein [Oceanobacillus saliphilus]|uniref:enoyl-CoA hydratase/isomerase family protein n=1 Tax=Oceanobacillus saliphilus TaxID=2925834 RepID=UPI00201E7487|nr:enoyl-CoA hydratase-related protein [Oceanobacillus saliphilus]